MADRLTLFMQVCNAAQHAHQKGSIHRDLKPDITVYQARQKWTYGRAWLKSALAPD